MSFLKPQTATGPAGTVAPIVPSTVPAWEDRPLSLAEGATWNPIPQNIAPIWPQSTALDVTIYISDSFAIPALNSLDQSDLALQEKNFTFGDYIDTRQHSSTIKLSTAVQKNGTLWAHYFIGKSGSALDPADSSYDTASAYHIVRPLSKYLPIKRALKTRNLFSSSNTSSSSTYSGKLASFYHPNLTLSFIPDAGTQNYPAAHPATRQYISLEASGARDSSGQNGWYHPILFGNDFWELRSQLVQLNSSVEQVPLHVTLGALPHWKFATYATLAEGFRQQARGEGPAGAGGGLSDGSEIEEIKRVLLETNVWLLSITGVVSLLHMIFETLAFKSDISHWRHKKDNVGVSVRTILANVFMQAVIFLYLLDNSEGTSWVILGGQGFGILLEAWKITKTVDVRLRKATTPNAWLPYTIVFEDKHALTETEKDTEEYDKIAFRYLSIAAVPLLVAYAIYSVVYGEHKGWYSYTITTLVGSVYAYGFLMMVPSLYINYRLGSVAHMPRKAMTYKFLNTFIDDLFAFTIKMPWLHRIATLRDDVIFFVYLYQAYKYKVDYQRVNEFGQGGDDAEVPVDKIKAAGEARTDVDGSESKRVIVEEMLKNPDGVVASGHEARTGKQLDTTSKRKHT